MALSSAYPPVATERAVVTEHALAALAPWCDFFDTVNVLYTFVSRHSDDSCVPVASLEPGIAQRLGRAVSLNDWVGAQLLDPDITLLYTSRVDPLPRHATPLPADKGYWRRGSDVWVMRLDSLPASSSDHCISTTSVESMVAIIQRRGQRFRAALKRFIAQCTAQQVDAPTKLEQLIHEHSNHLESICFNPMACSPAASNASQSLLDRVLQFDGTRSQLVPNGQKAILARAAQYHSAALSLDPRLMRALQDHRGITQLYTHQADAIQQVLHGQHVILATATASGKSLIYQLPILNYLLSNSAGCALCIYPTKALAQDQLRTFSEWRSQIAELASVDIGCYDGDTPSTGHHRRQVRANCQVLLSNPDMLHVGILPHHQLWRRFLTHIKYVVLDELHTYSGLWGAHVAWVLRRLRRLCRHLGNDGVQFIACSATIANPATHFKTLVGLTETAPVRVVTNDGAPTGPKQLALWHTNEDNGPMQSAKLVASVMRLGIRTIVFTKTREHCETLYTNVRQVLGRMQQTALQKQLVSYRGGYQPLLRRRIERDMFGNHTPGIIATNALELGIDIGQLDAVVLYGVPMDLASFWQQVGRAGRRGQEALALVIIRNDPWDKQFYRNPELLFDAPLQQVALDLDNTQVLTAHLQCAAHELKICLRADVEFFGLQVRSLCQTSLWEDVDKFICHPKYKPHPSRLVDLRGMADESTIAVVDVGNGHVLEVMELSRAIFSLYEGGMYLHRGQCYTMNRLDLAKMAMVVEKSPLSIYTRPFGFAQVTLRQQHRVNALRPLLTLCFGDAEVVTSIRGFQCRNIQTTKLLKTVHRTSPDLQQGCDTLMVRVPLNLVNQLTSAEFNVNLALHSLQHLVLKILPTLVVFGHSRVYGECFMPESSTVRSSFGQVLNSCHVELSAVFEAVLQRCVDGLQTCACQDGCPEYQVWAEPDAFGKRPACAKQAS